MSARLKLLVGVALAAIVCLGGPARAGDITAYTSLEEDDVRVYLAAFNKAKPGIKVNILRLSTGDLGARMLAEKANPRHDVIWGWAVTNMVDPRILEMTEPYKPAGIEKVNPAFKDPQGRWFATTGYFAGFCVNTEILKKNNLPMPASWEDLLNPAYKGQIVMPNAASSGTGYLQVSSILQMKGEEKGWQFLKALDKNIAQYIKSGSRPCKAASSGEFAIGLSFAFSGVKQIMEGYPVKLVIPKEGAGYETEVSALMKTSKNKADAKQFLDWLLTLDAAKLYGERAEMSSVPGAKPTEAVLKAGLPADVSTVLYKMDFDWSAKNKDRILAEWKKSIER
ncbi:MAG: ABC transporter substrate-binding protein [Alphaproteobacteria bacterium]|nr:ABC transporter substrate-binding protein [Alphaproteobacteria bacterium]